MIAIIIVFILSLIVFVSLFFLSKGKYDEYIEPLDKEKYGLKNFLPIGFYVLDKFDYKYTSKYDRKLYMKISELNEIKYAHFYMQVHWANRITMFVLSLLIVSLIGLSVGPDPAYIFFALIMVVVFTIIGDLDLDKEIKKRRMDIQIDFPDFINKLALLINAGMTVGRAWEKIVEDNKKDTPLYKELYITQFDIQGGKSEAQAYEDFARRCRTPEITKFIAVILQNLKKGNEELVAILKLQANESWEMRKNVAKKLGEEASAKLLFPMMIMFLAILIIVIIPAILAISGI